MRLSRSGKILRNLLVSALLAVFTAAALGFPPLTVRQMCRQVGRDLLLPDLEPVYEISYNLPHIGSPPRRTFVIAKSGPTYAAFQFQQDKGFYSRFYTTLPPRLANDHLLIPRFGSLYLTGDFADVSAATAQVTVQKTTVWQDYMTRQQTDIQLGERAVYTYNCVLENDQVLSFCYTEETSANNHPTSTTLRNVADHWYRLSFTNIPEDREVGLGTQSLDWEIPVDVTLYGADGQVLDTLHLTASVYDLSWDY